ncbi:MAG: DUF4421 family protein [Bacteroidales bacterium]|nr:DUF4421 family protein [Bacteroidales bacterium]
MKRVLLFIILCSISVFSLLAQDNTQSFWRKIDERFGLSSVKKIDTNYYTIAKNGWMINLNNNFAGFVFKSEMNDVPIYGNTKMNLHSKFNYQLSSTFGYRNLILGYSIANVMGEAKDFTLSLSSNAWGVEFRRLETDDMAGEIQTSSLSENLNVKQGDVKVKTKYLRAYHVFNNKRYSTTSAIDERCIQKKTAGSLLFYTNYAQNTVTFLNDEIVKRFDGIKTTEYSQAELGLGYGYNYPLLQGKLLFHAMAVPMFVVLHSDYITDNSLQEVQTKNKYFMNFMGRFTINYRFNDYLGLCFSFFYNTNRFTGEDNLKIRLNDYLIKTSLCFRF